MARWINVLWNNSFVNPPRLKTGAVALAQPGHMAGRQAGRQNATTFRDFKNDILQRRREGGFEGFGRTPLSNKILKNK